MGSWLSLIWGHRDDEEMDNSTGLTGKEKRLVTETWATLRKDPLATGTAITMAFFRKHPKYQNEFNAFKHLSVDALPENKRFQVHVTSVVTAVSAVVDSLNDPGLLEANLLSLGEKHQARGQTKEQFLNLKTVILDVLRGALQSKYTEEVAEAWNKTLDVAFSVVFKMSEKDLRRLRMGETK